MLPNIFWSRTDYISGAYATKMVAISSPVYTYKYFLHNSITTNGVCKRFYYQCSYLWLANKKKLKNLVCYSMVANLKSA